MIRWILAGLIALSLTAAVALWPRPRRWTVSREDLLPRARPYIHRSIGSRIHGR